MLLPGAMESVRDHARRGNYANREFRLGEIGHLSVVDNFVDGLLSNCVINQSPEIVFFCSLEP